jgi:hypothetical protein
MSDEGRKTFWAFWTLFDMAFCDELSALFARRLKAKEAQEGRK